MDAEIRAGCGEFRVAGRTLTGTVLRYGDTAIVRAPDGAMVRERFESAAFAPLPDDADLVLQHDESLVIAKAGSYLLTDSESQLEIRAELPAGSAALDLVTGGVLQGFSFRFFPQAERRDRDVRVIERAKLAHVGLVRSPAYPDSQAEVRAAQEAHGRWLERRRRYCL